MVANDRDHERQPWPVVPGLCLTRINSWGLGTGVSWAPVAAVLHRTIQEL